MTAYPTTVSEYLASNYHGKGDFFILFNPNGDNISAKGSNPLATIDMNLRDEVHQTTGFKLPTISEFRTGQMPPDITTHSSIDWDILRTAATGLVVYIQRPDLEPSIYLVQNDAKKDLNPDKWNFPSQLVGTECISRHSSPRIVKLAC